MNPFLSKFRVLPEHSSLPSLCSASVDGESSHGGFVKVSSLLVASHPPGTVRSQNVYKALWVLPSDFLACLSIHDHTPVPILPREGLPPLFYCLGAETKLGMFNVQNRTFPRDSTLDTPAWSTDNLVAYSAWTTAGIVSPL